MDIRIKLFLTDLLYPSPKKGMNPRSLNYLKVLLKNKSNSVLFATFPKSGWNWTIDIISYYIIKKFTGEYNVQYIGNGTLKEREKKPYNIFTAADARSHNAKTIRELFPDLNIDYCFHSASHWKGSPIWGLNNAKTVFIIRNIPTMLYSYYKSKLDRYSCVEDVIKGGVLDRAIKYYNTWGTFCSKYTNYKIFRYELFKKDSFNQFKQLIQYVFEIKIDDDLLKEALDYYSIENQIQREFSFCHDKNKHFHYKGSVDYTNNISKDTLEMIYKKLNIELKYKFGYTYP